MNPYTRAVSGHLRGIRAADRRQALSDLDDLLSDGAVTADELGPPEAYAANLREQLGRRSRRWGGFGLGRATLARVWNPADPRLFVPRALGLGWRLNVGALAVRLGWLRPDDADRDVLAAIPAGVRLLQQTMPGVLATATVVAAARSWRAGDRVPARFDPAGRVTGWVDRRWLLAPSAVAVAAAGWAWLPGTDEDAVLVRPALAASVAATTATVLWVGLRAHREPTAARVWLGPLVFAAPVVTELAATVLPVRSGLARISREER
ncbi:hypothetical protein CGZ94_14315 [Enemella evansiae]|uniref:DUF5808 domain-containing protein n=1 Tax=Enemella evansiae TaxID=2016499 RepID=A0A255G6P7_9ACTN|nr:DUF5808 domain-containing protein [Enemella evansiae]OYO11600.1 hypothetical protein CGZ94_14315 [Enemella evansiae]